MISTEKRVEFAAIDVYCTNTCLGHNFAERRQRLMDAVNVEIRKIDLDLINEGGYLIYPNRFNAFPALLRALHEIIGAGCKLLYVWPCVLCSVQPYMWPESIFLA
jgi:hypothetical protein